MQINKHGSFYIRNGWPTKIIDALKTDSYIFSPNNELSAVDLIGVGRVMVKSMRYWATVLGIANEAKDQHGVRHILTPLGEMILERDLYCIDKGTLWLLHRNLSRDIDNATAWNWAFNIYEEHSFTKSEFSTAFFAYLQREGASYTQQTVDKEFDCFKNTYVSDQVFSISKIIDEDTAPFLAPLKLLEYKGNGRFERRRTQSNEIPLDIFLACIIMDNDEHLTTNRQIDIEHLLEDSNQICKYMNLSYSALLEILMQLENKRYIRVVNNFGNRYIELNGITVNELLLAHYQLNGGKTECPIAN
jgi:hypothetical protein